MPHDPRGMEQADPPRVELPRSLAFLLAAAAGLTVANLYYNQPLLGLIRATYGATPRAVGLVSTATQLGYGLAMLLLVPLGDRYERRGLIVGMTAASAVALVGVVLAPSLAALLAMSLVLVPGECCHVARRAEAAEEELE